MGRIRTAAAKKFHEKDASSDDEAVTEAKRSTRAKKGSIANNSKSSRKSDRASRSTRNEKEVEKSASEKNLSSSEDETPLANKAANRSSRSTRKSAPIEKSNGKNGVEATHSDSEEDETPVVNRKRKALAENSSKPKPKSSTTPKKDASTSSKKKRREEERYEVEEILDHKFEDGSKYFLIRWKGYDSSVDSWESQYNISCPALLAKYYEKYPEASVSAKLNKKKKKKVIPKLRQLKIDEELDYNSEWDENEDYEVDRILDVYIHRNNKREFLIRWKGYSSKSDSWEPEENLDCADLIQKFMEKVEQIKNVTLKELRPVRSQTQRFTLMTQASARRLSKRNVGRQRAVYYDCDE